MRPVGLVALIATACGRFGFESPRTAGDASSDAPDEIADAPADAPAAFDAPADAPPAPCFAQFATAVYDDNILLGLPGVGQAIKIVAPSALHVTRLEVFTGEKAGTSRLGLSSHIASTDQPGADLGSATFQIALPDGWQGPDLPTPVDLAAGQTVWLVWSFVDGVQASIESTNPPGAQEYKVTFDNTTWMGPYMTYGLKLKLWCDGMHP